jgi:hypothetical protein
MVGIVIYYNFAACEKFVETVMQDHGALYIPV